MRKKTLFILMMAVTVCGICLTGCGSSDSRTGSEAESTVQSEEQVKEAAASSGDAVEKTEEAAVQTEGEKQTAKDGADMQTEDPAMPTRIPMEGGTKINMYFGDKVIPGVLNDSDTAKALIEKLPVTQHVSRYSHDFCGVTEDLPYKEEDVHYGWLNGDIDYATDAPYFTILFEDEDTSEQYGYQVNIGVITCPLEEIASLQGSYDVRIELAE